MATPAFRNTGPRGFIKVEINQRDLDRVQRQINAYSGKEFMRRGKRIFYLGVKLFERPLKTATPYWRYPDPPGLKKPRPKRGLLRASITTRQNDLRYGEVGAATTGPLKRKAPHRHLVTAGTKSHSLAPKRSGKGPYEVFIPRSGKQAQSRSKQYVWRQPDFKPSQSVAIYNFNRGARLQHPGAKKTPFVNKTQDQHEPRVKNFIINEMMKFPVPGPMPMTRTS